MKIQDIIIWIIIAVLLAMGRMAKLGIGRDVQTRIMKCGQVATEHTDADEP